VRLAKLAVRRRLPSVIKQIGCGQGYTTVRSTSAARKVRAAEFAPGAMRVTKRKVGGSMCKRAIMQHGANVTATVKMVM
jgi:hypothetical protein